MARQGTRRGRSTRLSTIVGRLELPLTGPAPWNAYNDLWNLLESHLLASPTPSDLYYHASVPASAVTDVWQPGRPQYDRFKGLPHS